MGKFKKGGAKGGGGGGGKGGKGGAKGSKKAKAKRDREWAHDGGAGFGIPDHDTHTHTPPHDDHQDQEQASSGPKKRRMTQALQDQIRRGKLKRLKRNKERAVLNKFAAARMEAEAKFARPPPGKARRHKHKKKRDGGGGDDSEEDGERVGMIDQAEQRRKRYLWIHQKGSKEEEAELGASMKGGEGEEGEEGEGGGGGRGSRKGLANGGGAYAALMAGLAAKGKQSKYKELLEQRRREQEGMTESDESEEEEEEENEEGEEEEEEEEEESGAEVGMVESGEEEEEEEEQEEEQQLEEEEEEEANANENFEEEEEDAADPFVQHWQRGPLEEDEEDSDDEGGGKIKTLATWKGPEIGEDDGDDPLLVQAVGRPCSSSSPSSSSSSALVPTTPLDPTKSPHLKKILKVNWPAAAATTTSSTTTTYTHTHTTTPLQSRLYPLLNSYQDVLFAGLTGENLEEVQKVTLLHLLNHVLKARGRVLKHNLRRRKEAKASRIAKVTAAVQRELAKDKEDAWEDDDDDDDGTKRKKKAAAGAAGAAAAAAAAAAASTSASATTLHEDEHEQDRDQGYTRPRVLMLLPMRGTALRVIKALVALLGPKTSVSGMARLEESYGGVDEEEEESEGEQEKEGEEGGEGDSKKKKRGRPRKPDDWQQLFGGNCDDDFKMGIALTPGQGKGKGSTGKGVAVKLFSEFYHSDLILASPLGLRLAMEAREQQGDAADFLSSIEIFVMDQADVLLMQNWDHVSEILHRLNIAPKKDHQTDFARVRHYVLEGQAAQFRQSLFLTRFLDPVITAALGKSCRNFRGKLRVKRQVENGSICQVALSVKQVFQRVPCPQPRLQGDARFEYFTKRVLPEINRLQQAHTLLFIPSYYDFVRLRNYAVRQELSHVCISEYERVSETSRGRARFFHGQRDFMLYTGRAHFFKRYMMRGAHHLVFYGLPENAHFYPEMVNLLEEAEGSAQVTSCFVMFTKYEMLALERVVGTGRAKHMVESEKATFLFC